MKIKDDGKMCGYEGEEWVSDYDFVPGRRQLMRQTYIRVRVVCFFMQ